MLSHDPRQNKPVGLTLGLQEREVKVLVFVPSISSVQILDMNGKSVTDFEKGIPINKRIHPPELERERDLEPRDSKACLEPPNLWLSIITES